MATLKFNRNGGQRVVDTIHEHDTPTIRKMLLGKAVKGETLASIFASLNHKDYKHAQELLFADGQLFQIIGKVSDAPHEDDREKPRVINKTKLQKQQEQQQKEIQEQELREKLQLLKQKWAA